MEVGLTQVSERKGTLRGLECNHPSLVCLRGGHLWRPLSYDRPREPGEVDEDAAP